MTPDRWKLVEQLYHSASQRSEDERSAYLREACADDEELCQEVEQLLRQESAAGFLDRPPLEAAAKDLAAGSLFSSRISGALMIGKTLSHYRILDKLGSGGMGEVYRATDLQLHRDVAVKVLPPSVAADKDRLRRFQQEARTASMLNHPNILVIYEFGSEDGAPYVVSELLDGQTLAELLKAGPLPVRKAVDFAAQISRGLSAAHAKGIVHRDLKPANIFITRDGRVKILDFGLAKLTQAATSGAGRSEMSTMTVDTEPGMVLGTVGYMSPEQVRGLAADARSDIFALGATFYEMLAGKRAFTGETAADILTAILKEDPPELPTINRNIPPVLERAVRRCLEKEPEQRFQSASDLGFALEAFSVSSTGGAAAPPVEAAIKGGVRVSMRAVVLTLLLALAGVGAVFFWLVRRSPVAVSWTGIQLGGSAVAQAPRISPDGQMLAFLALVNGQNQVAVMKPESGNWTVLTHQNHHGLTFELTWSRDGTRIYFDRATDVPQGVFSVPALGGEPRMILEDVMYPEALPDGSLIVARINAERQLQLHHFWPESERMEPLAAVVPLSGNTPVRTTPNGRSVVFYGNPLPQTKDGSTPHLYVLDLATGHPHRVAAFEAFSPYAPPLAITPDSRTLLLAPSGDDLQRVLAVPLDGTTTTRVLLTLTVPPFFLDVAKDGTLYADQVFRPREALRFPKRGGVPERLAEWQNGYGFLAPLPDERLLIFSVSAGRGGMFTTEAGGNLAPLVDPALGVWPPGTAIDQDHVAFLLGPEGQQQIAIVSTSSGRIVRRLEKPKGSITPYSTLSASPDGKTLYYTAGGWAWAVSINEGIPQKIHEAEGVVADPNGRDVIVKLDEKAGSRLMRVPLSGRPARPILIGSNFRLTPDPMSSSMVDAKGRIVIEVASPDSMFFRPAILDPTNDRLTEVPVQFQGDIWCPGWTKDGRIVAIGGGIYASLWRFQPEASPQRR